jgi:GH15 family glucan-1,4-alpha-glucosidase
VGGLRAAALTAARHEPALGDVYARASSEIAAALDRHLWDDSLGRYRRAVSLGRTDRSGGPVGSAFDRSLPYPNRRVRSMDEADPRLDSALLGLAWPFAPFGGSAERVRATVDAVERGLATPEDGLRRHEGDTYGGGYEWPLARLWLGLARRALGDGEAAPSPRWSDGGRHSTSCPSRYARTAARPGSCRSAGATRCCSSLPGRSWS